MEDLLQKEEILQQINHKIELMEAELVTARAAALRVQELEYNLKALKRTKGILGLWSLELEERLCPLNTNS